MTSALSYTPMENDVEESPRYFNFTHPETVSEKNHPEVYLAALNALKRGRELFVASGRLYCVARCRLQKQVDVYPELRPS